jgi:hypothetical protein
MTGADEIADLLVEVLNGLATSIAFEAINPAEIPVTDRENSPPQVQVYAYEENEEPADRGDMLRAERAVNVIVSAPMVEGRTKADCLAWLSEIKEGFRELTLTAADGSTWRWSGNQTITLYDFDAIKEKRQFVSLLRAGFYSFV